MNELKFAPVLIEHNFYGDFSSLTPKFINQHYSCHRMLFGTRGITANSKSLFVDESSYLLCELDLLGKFLLVVQLFPHESGLFPFCTFKVNVESALNGIGMYIFLSSF